MEKKTTTNTTYQNLIICPSSNQTNSSPPLLLLFTSPQLQLQLQPPPEKQPQILRHGGGIWERKTKKETAILLSFFLSCSLKLSQWELNRASKNLGPQIVYVCGAVQLQKYPYHLGVFTGMDLLREKEWLDWIHVSLCASGPRGVLWLDHKIDSVFRSKAGFGI